MYLMPTHSKTRPAFSHSGYEMNAAYHVAKVADGEIRAICGSENVEGPAKLLDRAEVPFGVCGRCKQLAKLP